MMAMHSLIKRIVMPTCEIGLIATRGVHTTPVVAAGARYRESKQKERHISSSRIFADTPDWSYLDGRPAPLGSNQRRRYNEQVGYNKTIQRMIHEIDTAKEAEAQRIATIAETKQQIIASKLRAKGKYMFEDSKKGASQNVRKSYRHKL